MTLAANLKALQWYENEADYYASLCGGISSAAGRPLRRLTEIVGEGGTVFEFGSGPGVEADYLESLGVDVVRTDATAAFVEMQRARGKDAEQLNVITDDLGGPYQGVLSLCVLLHISVELTDQVLAKVAGALAPGGAYLVSVRANAGRGRDIVWWKREEDFAERLERAGLRVEWSEHSVDSDDDAWWTFIAVRD